MTCLPGIIELKALQPHECGLVHGLQHEVMYIELIEDGRYSYLQRLMKAIWKSSNLSILLPKKLSKTLSVDSDCTLGNPVKKNTELMIDQIYEAYSC